MTQLERIADLERQLAELKAGVSAPKKDVWILGNWKVIFIPYHIASATATPLYTSTN